MYFRILLITCLSFLLTADSIWHTGNTGKHKLYATEESVLEQQELTGDPYLDVLNSIYIHNEEASEHHSINDLPPIKVIMDIPLPPPKTA